MEPKQLSLFGKIDKEKPQPSLKDITTRLDISKNFVEFVEEHNITLNPFESPEIKIKALRDKQGYDVIYGRGGEIIHLEEREIIPHSYRIRILGKAFQRTYFSAKKFISKHS